MKLNNIQNYVDKNISKYPNISNKIRNIVFH